MALASVYILQQVGLAVGDIQAVQDEAALQKLALQVWTWIH